MILDTFMYLNYEEARDGSSIKEILKELETHPDYGGGGVHAGEYTILREAAENEAVGNLEICGQSAGMGYDSGTAACTFIDRASDSFYVVYRGTGDGEWPDNGIGMTSAATVQQKRALDYFEETVEYLGIEKSDHLVVTGHSKGGNKAQFVTMETKYDGLVDVCYSVDGQGFSEAAICRWKEQYGEEEYTERREKLYGICGENDYVNVLGNGIILEEHVRYVKTPVEKMNFAGYHDIKYMFASLSIDEHSGKYVTSFHGRKNSDVPGQGVLGRYAMSLSLGMMSLMPEQRDGCGAVIMQLMEALGGERKSGLNGEKLKWSDLKDFTIQGIPLIAAGFLEKEEGRSLLRALVKNQSLSGEFSASVTLQVDYRMLRRQSYQLEALAQQIRTLTEETGKIADEVPLYMKGYSSYYHRIRLSEIELDKIVQGLIKLAGFQEKSADAYRSWEM